MKRKTKLTILGLFFLFGLTLIFRAHAYDSNDPTSPPDYLSTVVWQPTGSDKLAYFNLPYSITFDSSGNFYVADTGNNRIQKFNSSGVFQAKWGSSGSGDGQFSSPYSIAFDSSGNIYVTDTGNNRIQKFNSEMEFQAKWGSYGTGDGQFSSPYSIAFDSSGNIYVTDTGNNRIQKFNSSGVFQTKWNTRGKVEGGLYSSPRGIAVYDNNLYVVDIFYDGSWNERDYVEKYDLNGNFLSKWGSNGTGNGQFRYPYGIFFDSSGNIYIADSGNNRIQKFNSSGVFQTKWGSSGSSDGQFNQPHGVVVDSSGNFYVADTYNYRIQKFNSSGVFQFKWGSAGSSDGALYVPVGLAFDNENNFYVVDQYNNRIQKFDSNGNFITKWGSSGSGDGQFSYPYGIAIDENNNIYVNDMNNRIQKFDSDGNFVTKWGSRGSGNGQFNYSCTGCYYGMTIGSDNKLYVTDPANKRIQKFDLNGSFVGKFNVRAATEGGASANIGGIAFDSDNNIYITDSFFDAGYTRSFCYIEKYDSSGNFLEKWDDKGSGDGEFSAPSDIKIDQAGNIYISDNSNHRIQKFNSEMEFLTKWGSRGAENDQFNQSKGMAIDSSGKIYVADSYNHRIQIFGDGTAPENHSSDIEFSSRNGSGQGNLNKFSYNYTDSNPKLQGTNEAASNGTLEIYKKTKNGSKKLIDTVSIDENGNWDCTLDLKKGKKMEISFKTIDEAGNEADTSTWYTFFYDNNKPTFLTPPTPNSQIITRNQRTIHFQAQDEETEIDRYTLKILKSSQKKWKKLKSTATSYTIPAKFKKGTYTLVIRAYDKAGNRAEKRITINVR